MKREQTTIRLPHDLKDQIQREADRRGMPKQTTLRVQSTLYDNLKTIAEQMGLTVTSVLIVAIWWSVLKPKDSQRQS